MGLEQFDLDTKANKNKGCYISPVTAVFFVLMCSIVIIAVGLIVHFAETSGKTECKCIYPKDTTKVDSAPQNRLTTTPANVECPTLGNDCDIDALVSTHWLNRKLFRKGKIETSCVQVLDISWSPGEPDSGYQIYLDGHIPGAQFYNYSECTSGAIGDLPELSCFVNQMMRMGISKSSHIILYDRFEKLMSVRMWWNFKLFGHARVSILDGSIEKWALDGYENTTIIPSDVNPGNFQINYNPDLIVHFADVVNIISSNETQIVDARARDLFLGNKDIGDLKNGHMPGAKNVQFSTLFNADTTFKSPQELEQLFIDARVDLEKKMIVTCVTGVAASGLAVAAYVIGKNVPVYDGSWEEWSNLAPDALIVIG